MSGPGQGALVAHDAGEQEEADVAQGAQPIGEGYKLSAQGLAERFISEVVGQRLIPLVDQKDQGVLL